MPNPVRQQISDFLTGTSISGVLRVTPVENNMVYAVFSAETILANLTGPSGYTKAVEREGDGVSVQIWYKRAGAAESATVTATSSVSVPLRIHVFESPEAMFVAGDPLDVVASNDSSTTAVTTLATGTTATVGQANTFAIAAVGALGGNEDFLLVNWSDDYTALSDHETRGLMVGFKNMTSATAATAAAIWNQATAPTSHKAAAAIATFALAGPVTLSEPYPRRVSFGRFGAGINTTGTTDTVATFPVVTDHLYLAFVATSKDAANDGDAVIPDSHGAALDWVLEQSHSIGTSRRIHMFRAMSTSDLSAASISVTTPETACSVWWEVLDVSGVLVSGVSGEGAIAQIATGSTPGATFVETNFAAVPVATNAAIGFCLHGTPQRQLVDLDPDVHLLLGEANVYDTGGQRATVALSPGVDQTFRWDWASSIHALTVLVEVQADAVIGGDGYPQTVAPTETLFTANTTAHLVTMPPIVDPGDLLLLCAAFDSIPTIANPNGWTPQENESGNSHARLIAAKIADGTEGGTAVDVVTSAAERGVAQVYRITDWWGSLADGLAIGTRNGAGGVANNNVPPLDPSSWAVEYTLWLAVVTAAGGASAIDIVTYPTNYGNGVESDSGGGTAGALLGSARREFAGAFDDPDAFVFSVVPGGSATRLIAIRPLATSQPPPPIVSDSSNRIGGTGAIRRPPKIRL